MPTETGKAELSISGNSKLLAGIAGAANHFGEVGGLDDKGRADFVAAIEDACREALQDVPGERDRVELSFEALPGRIEAVLRYQSHGAGKPAGASSGSHRSLLTRLDDVKREVNGNKIRLTLIKKT